MVKTASGISKKDQWPSALLVTYFHFWSLSVIALVETKCALMLLPE